MSRRANKRSQSSASKRLSERDAQANHIPMFKSTVTFKHMFRYMEITSGGTFNITRANLLNLLQVMDGDGVHSWRLNSGVKLNKIDIRCPTATSDVAVTTASVEWTSTYGPSSEVSDTGTPLHPPFISTSPPRQSLASFWSLTGANESDVLMILVLPLGAIVDVWFEYVMMDGQTPVTNAPASALASGTVFAAYLDGIGTGKKLQPVSYTTTT